MLVYPRLAFAVCRSTVRRCEVDIFVVDYRRIAASTIFRLLWCRDLLISFFVFLRVAGMGLAVPFSFAVVCEEMEFCVVTISLLFWSGELYL